MGKEEYVVVKIPKDLADEIDRFMGRYGYRSRAELVKEAVRLLLRQYETYERGGDGERL